jgi:hypothetical protein
MAFTRFHDDPCRIKKQLQETTGIGRYMLNVPGNGVNVPFIEDPFIRMQKWGANLMSNPINLESDLKGLTRSINRDCVESDNYKTHAVKTAKVNYPSLQTVTEQPRITHPAWTARDLAQTKWDVLPLNPQENVCYPFENNVSTRIVEKNSFIPCSPQINNMNF